MTERPFEVIDRTQKLLDQALVSVVELVLPLPGSAALEVLELGREPQVLVPERLDLRRGIDFLWAAPGVSVLSLLRVLGLRRVLRGRPVGGRPVGGRPGVREFRGEVLMPSGVE